jgi:hypothetical protein
MRDRLMRDRFGGFVCPAFGALLSVATLLIPWSLIGSAHRSGLALIEAVQASGMVSGGWSHVPVLIMGALPIAASLAVAAQLLGRPLVSSLCAAYASASVVAIALIAICTPSVGPEIGPWLGAAIGITTLVAASWRTVSFSLLRKG